MIVAKNLNKTYNNGNVEALKDVSVEIADGAFVVILGASGSGKSTLMNVLSGLEKADSGQVTISGQSLTEMNDKSLTEFRRKNISFVFQQDYMLNHSEYMPLIEALGLQSKLKSKPCELSGGEQQRVCIARALAKKPSILFLDEPTGALDEKTGRGVLDCIVKEKEKLGFTMIMVTHNQNIAEMAQIVVKMNSGKIVDMFANDKQKNAYKIGW